jgi:putative membrane protein insertion efficiency factor
MTAKLLIALIRAYQLVLSPFLGGHCRFVPSCSAYAREAIETHGAARGTLLALRRLSKCHPFGSSGVDPVPARAEHSARTEHSALRTKHSAL